MHNPELYPLKFYPILKDKIWGGKKLKTILNKASNSNTCGESWEISAIEGSVSVVAEGLLKGELLPDLIKRYQGDLVGNSVFKKFTTNFPLLVKFIDANQDLSIQVHPNDFLAKEKHQALGKTELWYVLDSRPKSTLVSGFNKPISKDEYLARCKTGKLIEVLNNEQVKKDDVFFLPAGRIHSIGKGLLIAEIQQSSDITYRVFDFDRTDYQGNKRDLHLEESKEAIDFNYSKVTKTPYDKLASEVLLKSCKYFVINRLSLKRKKTREYIAFDSFIIIMCLHGNGTIEYNKQSITYTPGDTFLIPNKISCISIVPNFNSKILEIYIP